MYIYTHTYNTYTHTHTHIYIYIYINKRIKKKTVKKKLILYSSVKRN